MRAPRIALPPPSAPPTMTAPATSPYGLIDLGRFLSNEEYLAYVKSETQVGRDAGMSDDERCALLLSELHDGGIEIGVRPEVAKAMVDYAMGLPVAQRLEELHENIAAFRFLHQSDNKAAALARYAADINAGFDETPVA